MTPMPLSRGVLHDIFTEARACYPTECCGVVVGPPDRPDAWRFVRFDNLQDKLHAADPETFPRDARTAYAMDPLRVQRLADELEADGGAIVAVVHSHPEHPSYFSPTDKRAAAPFGEPTWPRAVQLVASVFAGEVVDLRGFSWDGEDWPERDLAGLPPLPGPPPGARPLEGF